MEKKRKAKSPLSPEQTAARKLNEPRHRQADEVMANPRITKGWHLGISVWTAYLCPAGTRLPKIVYLIKLFNMVFSEQLYSHRLINFISSLNPIYIENPE